MSGPRSYLGSCHCGKVRYKVTLDIQEVLACNCSICTRTGALMAFVPATSLEVVSGEDEQTDYQFNEHNVHHLFCRTCGVRSFGRGIGPGGAEMCMVNVRCLEGVDLQALRIKHVDGRSR